MLLVKVVDGSIPMETVKEKLRELVRSCIQEWEPTYQSTNMVKCLNCTKKCPSQSNTSSCVIYCGQDRIRHLEALVRKISSGIRHLEALVRKISSGIRHLEATISLCSVQ